MATIARNNKKKQNNMMGLLGLCCILLIGSFIAVFFFTNNKVSFDALFSDTSSAKYPAAAFVNKRKGLRTTSAKRTLPDSTTTTGYDLSAEIAFDPVSKRARLSLRDKNNKPLSRITVFGTVSYVGNKQIRHQFRMNEYTRGEFRSKSLDLADGGWILMVSAYTTHTNNPDKMLFHTERVIFLGDK